MNEITRIHLAKTPYNIELAAKKALGNYLKSLENYAHDTELVNDIELRMVELLAERSVKPEGTIGIEDVEALRQQLGEPEAFIDEADVVDPAISADGKTSHKLYRHTNRAIFGGVAGGIGEYFGINPLWVRLIIIALAFASFGTAIVVYIVLWIVLPPVKTAADLLQLRGKPVTVNAIREASVVEGPIEQGRDKKALRVVTILLGIGVAIAALGVLFATLSLGSRALITDELSYYGEPQAYLWLIITAIAGGVLLASLFGIAAYAAFRQKISKKIVITSAVIIILGLAAVAVVVTGGIYQSNKHQEYIERNTTETTLPLEVQFGNVKNLTLAGENANLAYVVDDNPRLSFTTFKENPVKPKVTVDGESAQITIEQTQTGSFFYDPTVTIYGPALEMLEVESGGVQYSNQTAQEQLNVSVLQSDRIVEISDATIENLTVTVASDMHFSATGAAIESATITMEQRATVALGHVRQLTLSTQESCPAFDEKTTIEIASVTESEMTLNGQEVSARSSSTACTNIEISHLADIQ